MYCHCHLNCSRTQLLYFNRQSTPNITSSKYGDLQQSSALAQSPSMKPQSRFRMRSPSFETGQNVEDEERRSRPAVLHYRISRRWWWLFGFNDISTMMTVGDRAQSSVRNEPEFGLKIEKRRQYTAKPGLMDRNQDHLSLSSRQIFVGGWCLTTTPTMHPV